MPNKSLIGCRILLFLILMIGWVIFSGLMDSFHLSLGVISCFIISWVSTDLVFQGRQRGVVHRLILGAKILMYFAWMIWQIMLSNLHLLKLAISGKSSLQPQIVKYETKLETDFEKYLLANSITLTPGTVTMKIIGQVFYIHAISDVSVKGLDGEMERRIAKIFAKQ